MPYFILLCILLALVLLWISSRQMKTTGLPGGKIVSSDTSAWQPVEAPLYAPIIGLTGKPDYLIQQGSALIPVEVKSSSRPDRGPYDSHILQLAAYCLLVEAVYRVRPSHGVLHYTSRTGKSSTYEIPFTPGLENEVRSVIEQIQAQTLRGGVDRSHNSPSRCAHCGFRSDCDQALRGGA
jgi:CRISPR-associated exonuclease Cas4